MMILLWGGALLYQAPRFDEFYHLLGARSWLTTGDYEIGQGGRYLKALPITYGVARLLQLFGDHLAVARLVGAIPTALLVILAYAWLFSRVSAAVALIWTGFAVLSPFLMEVAAFTRWYGLIVLFSGIFLASLVEILLGWSTRSALLGPILGLTGSALVLAFIQLEVLGPLLLMAGVMLSYAVWHQASPRHRRAIVAGACLGLVVILAIGFVSGGIEELWRRYRWSIPWSEEHKNEVLFYHRYLLLYYPTFWPVTGLLWLLGRRVSPGLADMAAVVAGLGLLFHAGAGMKATRYVAYLMPWLYLVWGLGLVGTWQYLRGHGSWRPQPWLLKVGVAGSLLFAFFGNAASVRALTLALGITVPPEQPPADWRGAAAILAGKAAQAEVIITSSELETLYAFGRADYAINRSLYVELKSEGPVLRDRRSGVLALRDATALDAILRCSRTALVVSDIYRWRDPGKATDPFADRIEQQLEPVDLPTDSRIKAWWWRNGSAQDSCPQVAADGQSP